MKFSFSQASGFKSFVEVDSLRRSLPEAFMPAPDESCEREVVKSGEKAVKPGTAAIELASIDMLENLTRSKLARMQDHAFQDLHDFRAALDTREPHSSSCVVEPIREREVVDSTRVMEVIALARDELNHLEFPFF